MTHIFEAYPTLRDTSNAPPPYSEPTLSTTPALPLITETPTSLEGLRNTRRLVRKSSRQKSDITAPSLPNRGSSLYFRSRYDRSQRSIRSDRRYQDNSIRVRTCLSPRTRASYKKHAGKSREVSMTHHPRWRLHNGHRSHQQAREISQVS
jgi:hypothetical protein